MIRAVYFDAVGTLIHPAPGAAEVYADVGRRRGSRYLAEEIRQRFTVAYQWQETLDRAQAWKTSEMREWRRWHDIVADVLDDVRDVNICFSELYLHFAKAQAWEVAADAQTVLTDLERRGYVLGIASNYDSRLREAVAGVEPLKSIDRLVISSEVGWRKPAPAFFEAICRQAGAPPEAILYVGDERVNDVEAAQAAGLRAVLVDRNNASTGADHIRQLSELPKILADVS
jgi:putative hydrolase of the HAD superfamily